MLRTGLLVLLCVGLCAIATSDTSEDSWAERNDLTGEAEIALHRIEEKQVQLIQSQDTPSKAEHKMCAMMAKKAQAKPKAKFIQKAPVKKFSFKKGRKLLGHGSKTETKTDTTDAKTEDAKTPTKDKQDLVNKAKEAFEKFKEKAGKAGKDGKKDMTKGGKNDMPFDKSEDKKPAPDDKDAAKLVLATVRMASDEAAAKKKAFQCCVIRSKCRAAMKAEAGKAVMDADADKDKVGRRLMGSTGENIVPTDKADKTPAPAPANDANEADFEKPVTKPDKSVLEDLANKIKALMAKVNECVANTDKTC